MADGGIKMKLAVDRTQNRVLFADAGSDMVDVLLSFLTLPLSAVQLVAGASSPGCLSTLCRGVSCLREGKLLRFDACHDMLLRPQHEDEFESIWCLRHEKCSCTCYSAIVRSDRSLQVHGTDCRCWQVMARIAHAFNRKEGVEKFVKGNQRFVISDDLVIKPASTANTRLLLQNVCSGRIDPSFEDIEVCVGWKEVVAILRACILSKTVFTDTFLSKQTEVCAAVNLRSAPNIQHQSDGKTDPSPQCNIKVFYDSQEKKVLYAECDQKFVHLLLSFLVYPLACMIKNLAGASLLGCCLDNLYSSVIGLHATVGFLSGYETLRNPGISPFQVSDSLPGKKLFHPFHTRCCQFAVPLIPNANFGLGVANSQFHSSRMRT